VPEHRIQVNDPRDVALVELRVATEERGKRHGVQRRPEEHRSQARCGLVRGASGAVQQSADRRMVDAGALCQLPLGYPTLLKASAHQAS
jgi:hypothetical protein